MMMMVVSDLSSEQEQQQQEEVTGSNSHGSSGDMVIGAGGGHVLMTPLFSPPAHHDLLRRTPAPPLLQQQHRLLPEEPNKLQAKRKRSQPGNPDPEAEVIALSPRTLVATNRFVCEVCNKGFQRDQNLQLHRRGHNLPWKLRQRGGGGGGLQLLRGGDGGGVRKRVYVCPEPTCVHHDPARALGDLTGIKKHFSRKHGEKRWRCERCGKRYAVHSDWKAHVKNCGTREYRCDCGILFSRKDSLLTHRAFCDALAEESARLLLLAAANNSSSTTTCNNNNNGISSSTSSSPLFLPAHQNPNPLMFLAREAHHHQQQQQQLQFPPFHPLTYLDDDLSTAAARSLDVAAGDVPAVSFVGALTPEGRSVALQASNRRFTRDFLGVDDAGEVEELQLPPLCATACHGRPITAAAAACCATDLTRQYLGGRLPSVNETWSHNF